MTGRSNFDRTLAAWFEADGSSPAPDGTLKLALDATRRRRPRPTRLAGFGSHWVGEALGAEPRVGTRPIPRSSDINRSFGLGLVALILVATLVGIQLVGGLRLGSPGQTPSLPPAPSLPSVSPTGSPSPEPSTQSASSPPVLNFDPSGVTGPVGATIQGGPLIAGTYTYSGLGASGTAFQVAFSVPAGWTWNGNYLSKGATNAPGGAGIYFFASPIGIYPDPCHWDGAQPPLTGSVDDFIAALVGQPGRNPSAPINRGNGISVELTVPVYADIANCDRSQYRSWGPDADGNPRVNQDPGQRDLVWALPTSAIGVALQGEYLVVDVGTFPGTPTSVSNEIAAILKTLKVGHWG